MVKIIFSNGESVEWNDRNFPDKVSIFFDPGSKQPVPDRISADHLESCANVLAGTLKYIEGGDFRNRVKDTINHARMRADFLRGHGN